METFVKLLRPFITVFIQKTLRFRVEVEIPLYKLKVFVESFI